MRPETAPQSAAGALAAIGRPASGRCSSPVEIRCRPPLCRCAAINENSRVRVAVLRGAGGKAFVAGTDIAQFREFANGHDGVAYEARLDGFIDTLERLRVPTIAVVEGFAVGAGLAIANACDIRIAASGARFGVPIARNLGNCLSAANLRRLCATLGVSWVKRMLLLAEMPRPSRCFRSDIWRWSWRRRCSMRKSSGSATVCCSTRRSQLRQRGKHCDASQLHRMSTSRTSLGPATAAPTSNAARRRSALGRRSTGRVGNGAGIAGMVRC
jgi:hypothetical protein